VPRDPDLEAAKALFQYQKEPSSTTSTSTTQQRESPYKDYMFQQQKQEALRMPSDTELQDIMDRTLGFAMPVVRMEHMGLESAMKGMEGTRATLARERVRRLVSVANRNSGMGELFGGVRTDE